MDIDGDESASVSGWDDTVSTAADTTEAPRRRIKGFAACQKKAANLEICQHVAIKLLIRNPEMTFNITTCRVGTSQTRSTLILDKIPIQPSLNDVNQLNNKLEEEVGEGAGAALAKDLPPLFDYA